MLLIWLKCFASVNMQNNNVYHNSNAWNRNNFSREIQLGYWWVIIVPLYAGIFYVATWNPCIEINLGKTVLLCDTVHQISRGETTAAGLTAGQPRPRTPRGRSGGPYHVTTQFYFYPVMSKIQNSSNIYPWIWCRLTCPTQDFGNT